MLSPEPYQNPLTSPVFKLAKSWYFHLATPQSSCKIKEKVKRNKASLDMEKREKVTVASSPMALMGSRVDNEEENGGMQQAEVTLRLLPMALCITALVLMLKNSQSNDFGSVSYSNLGAFRYLLHANGICAGYSLLSAIVAAMPRTSTVSLAWTFFILDQLLTYAILAAAAASTEVLYLAHEGDAAVTWSAACGSFGRFCHKATASVIITFMALACYTMISLISSYKLFTRYDAPADYSTKGTDMAAFRT